jgi:integrase
MPERKKQRDGSYVVLARPYDRRPDAKPKRPVLGRFPDTEKGWKAAERAEGVWYDGNRPDVVITVGRLREQYLADHAVRWDVLSTEAARHRLRAFCDAHAEQSVERIDSQRCRMWLGEHPRDREALRAMWAWGLANDLGIESIPWDRIGGRGSAKARRADIVVPGRGALTEDELGSLVGFVAAVQPWLGAVVMFLGYTGLREGEAFAARPDWLSADGQLLEVSQQYRSRAPRDQRWTLPKYGKVRTIALLEEAAEALERLPRGTFLITNPRDGDHFTAGAFAYYWNGLAAAWSVGSDAPSWLRTRYRLAQANRGHKHARSGAFTLHELRHTYATVLLESGVIHDKVALQLGDTVEQVYKTYGHPRSIEAARDVLRIRAEGKARRQSATVTDLAQVRARTA